MGNQMDWLYATYGILRFRFEMGDASAVPDEAIPTETACNMEAAYYAIEQAAATERAAGPILPADTVLPHRSSLDRTSSITPRPGT